MASLVYFGNRSKQSWIPAPRAGMEFSLVRRSNVIQLENGGVYIDDSKASHREGMPDWEAHPDDLRIIREFYNGVWGAGPYWWVDPFAMDRNLFAPNWATPGIIGDGDWPEIHSSTSTPATVSTGLLGLPAKAATYTPSNLAPSAPARRFTLLIPPGYKLAFGAHGTATGSGVVALRGTKADGGSALYSYAPLDPAGTTAFNTVGIFPYSDGYRLVDIYLARSAGVVSTITLSGMRAILVREEASISSVAQPFVTGEGTGALQFSGQLRETLIHSPNNYSQRRKGMSVKLIETGDWT